MTQAINRPHIRQRHGPPAVRSTHGSGPSPTAPGGIPGLYGGSEIVKEQVTRGGISPGSIDHVRNGPATVVVDEDGLHVSDGAIFIEDLFGNSVLSAGGFEGSWLSFLGSGFFYNADFGVGSTTAVLVSEVGSGATVADYVASLHPGLPYWVVSQSDGTIRCEADAASKSGQSLELSHSPGEINRIYQDVPIQGGRSYTLRVNLRWEDAFIDSLKVFVSWRDETHAIIGSRVEHPNDAWASGVSVDQLTFIEQELVIDALTMGAALPLNAYYLRVELEFAGSGTVFNVSHVVLDVADHVYSRTDTLDDFSELASAVSMQSNGLFLNHPGMIGWGEFGTDVFADTWSDVSAHEDAHVFLSHVAGSPGHLLVSGETAGGPGAYLTGRGFVVKGQINADANATTDEAINAKNDASSTPRWSVFGDGAMKWAAEDGTHDVKIERTAAGELKIRGASDAGAKLVLGDTDQGSDQNVTALTLGIERPWTFDQFSSGATAGLRLSPDVTGDKQFQIASEAAAAMATFAPGATVPYLLLQNSRLRLNTVISPTALAANTNDWNPTGLATCNVIRVGTDATPRTLTGIVAGNDGDILILHNRNTSTALTLAHDVTSTAANRFFCPGAVNFSLTGKKSVVLYYSGDDDRWLVIG